MNIFFHLLLALPYYLALYFHYVQINMSSAGHCTQPSIKTLIFIVIINSNDRKYCITNLILFLKF